MNRDDPIIVLGTAGTGTRVFSNLLESAGVFMGLRRNPQRDNRDFIRVVKDGIPLLDHHAPLADSFLRQAGCPDFEISRLEAGMAQQADQCVSRFKSVITGDLLSTHQRWGWKESQSMFVLPFLKRHFPRLRIVHVVRDGRDIAFSKQQRAPFQAAYVRCLANLERPPLNDDDWAVMVAKTWQINNEAVAQWAALNLDPGQYFLARLEHLKEDPVAFTERFFELMDLDVQVSEQLIEAADFDPDSLRLEKYKTKDPEIIEKIEAVSAEALGRFGYL
jgi:hypothetical protein